MSAVQPMASINSVSDGPDAWVQCRTINIRKRSFDVAVAMLAIAVLAPVFLLIALAVKLSDGGSILYGHQRVGRFGKTFRCWKFRSMVPNGDEVLAAHIRNDPDAAAEWQTARKLRRDPRITRVGRLLRAFSLDELPQLFNIVSGEMSLVGPRPVTADELGYYGPHLPFYLQVRPGLTGLWQISGRNDVSYDDRVSLDRQYVETWNFGRDLLIIARTVPAVCLSRGTY